MRVSFCLTALLGALSLSTPFTHAQKTPSLTGSKPALALQTNGTPQTTDRKRNQPPTELISELRIKASGWLKVPIEEVTFKVSWATHYKFIDRYVYSYRFEHKPTRGEVTAILDEQGNLPNEALLSKADMEAKVAKYGSMVPNLGDQVYAASKGVLFLINVDFYRAKSDPPTDLKSLTGEDLDQTRGGTREEQEARVKRNRELQSLAMRKRSQIYDAFMVPLMKRLADMKLTPSRSPGELTTEMWAPKEAIIKMSRWPEVSNIRYVEFVTVIYPDESASAVTSALKPGAKKNPAQLTSTELRAQTIDLLDRAKSLTSLIQ